MKLTLIIQKRWMPPAEFQIFPSRQVYDAFLLGPADATGARPRLLFPPPIAYREDPIELETEVKAHLARFGVTDIPVVHRDARPRGREMVIAER